MSRLIGDRPLTSAERMRRTRKRREAERERLRDALRQVVLAPSLAEARRVAMIVLELPRREFPAP